MEEHSFNLVDKVYFCEINGVKMGYIEKIHDNNLFDVLVDDPSEARGYKKWRVEGHFLARTPEEARLRWDDYRLRLYQFKKVLDIKRKQHRFFRGLSVIAEPFNKLPYKGMVLLIGKAALVLATENGKLMKVDKSICKPIDEIIHFRKEV